MGDTLVGDTAVRGAREGVGTFNKASEALRCVCAGTGKQNFLCCARKAPVGEVPGLVIEDGGMRTPPVGEVHGLVTGGGCHRKGRSGKFKSGDVIGEVVDCCTTGSSCAACVCCCPLDGTTTTRETDGARDNDAAREADGARCKVAADAVEADEDEELMAAVGHGCVMAGGAARPAPQDGRKGEATPATMALSPAPGAGCEERPRGLRKVSLTSATGRPDAKGLRVLAGGLQKDGAWKAARGGGALRRGEQALRERTTTRPVAALGPEVCEVPSELACA